MRDRDRLQKYWAINPEQQQQEQQQQQPSNSQDRDYYVTRGKKLRGTY